MAPSMMIDSIGIVPCLAVTRYIRYPICIPSSVPMRWMRRKQDSHKPPSLERQSSKGDR